MSYYNTTSETGQTLMEFRDKSRRQELVIKDFFEARPSLKFSPSEVWVKMFDPKKTPLTSVRRSMTSLCKKEWGHLLIKLDEKKKGVYGRGEHYWILNNNRDGRT